MSLRAELLRFALRLLVKQRQRLAPGVETWRRSVEAAERFVPNLCSRRILQVEHTLRASAQLDRGAACLPPHSEAITRHLFDRVGYSDCYSFRANLFARERTYRVEPSGLHWSDG